MQSRIKELEKIDRIEIPRKSRDPLQIPAAAAIGPHGGRSAKGLAKSYGEKQVLEDVNFTIERGDRIALVGVNGAGKSTLIKLMPASEQPTPARSVWATTWSANISPRTNTRCSTANARMLDDISRARRKVPRAELRSLLGCFLFSGDDVFKPLGVLSGGERNRYALARILVRPANFLLLDEPTNHLDLRAKEVLLEAIARLLRHGHLCLARSLFPRCAGHARLRSGKRHCASLPATTKTTCAERQAPQTP